LTRTLAACYSLRTACRDLAKPDQAGETAEMPVDVLPGGSPLILAFAGTGSSVPPSVFARLSDAGQSMHDTDWHLGRLFSNLLDDLTAVRANFNRCLSDPNIGPPDPGARPLAPGGGFVPFENADGVRLWDRPPSIAEISKWKSSFYVPYHAALSAQIARARARHGFAVLCDCRTRPGLTMADQPQPDGRPDLMLDTNLGASCSLKLAAPVNAICQSAKEYRSVLNDRQTTGWTTRAYGRPKSGIHAMQLTVAQSTYLTGDKDTLLYDEDKANRLRALLRDILKFMVNWRPF
jgi:formiminoglutamase